MSLRDASTASSDPISVLMRTNAVVTMFHLILIPKAKRALSGQEHKKVYVTEINFL
jgi:hypothetical protein